MTRASQPPSGSDQPAVLNGWKEIAAYFRKGVRTVQRWEVEMDLPVHRLAGPKGEVVYAVPAELDEWRRTQERGVSGSAFEPDDDGASPDEVAPPAGPAARRRWLRAGSVVLGVVSLAGLAWTGLAWVSRRPHPTDVRVAHDTATAVGADGATLWTAKLPYPVPPDNPTDPVATVGTRHRHLVADIDGDGGPEVLVAAMDEGLTRGDLICLDARGRTRWTRRPDRAVTFGHGRMTAPWLPYFFSVLGQGSSAALWVSWVNRPEFGAFVERLDPATGQPTAVYWSAGYVTHLISGIFDGRPALFLGAANNEHRGASLAVYDLDVREGAAPASNPRYACSDCPGSRPRAFLVFPKTTLARELVAQAGTLSIEEIIQDAAGQVKVVVDHSLRVAGQIAAVMYRFDARLHPLGAETLPNFQSVRRQLEREGRLAPASNADDERELFPVLSWAGERFAEVRPDR
jgi:hypothetical protein